MKHAMARQAEAEREKRATTASETADGLIMRDAAVRCPAPPVTRGSLLTARTAEPVTDGDDTLDMPYGIDDGAAQLASQRLAGDCHDAVADRHGQVLPRRRQDGV